MRCNIEINETKEKGKTFTMSKGKVLERSNNRYKINTMWVKMINPVGFLFLWSLQRHGQKQKAKMEIVRKKNTKEDVNGKMNFFSIPGNSQKDNVHENTNSMFDENKILQDEKNV